MRHYLGRQRRDVRLERQLAAEMDRSSRLLDGGLIAPGSSPSRLASNREQAVLLADALKGLPADYREVLILRHLEGLTFLSRASTGRGHSLEIGWGRKLSSIGAPTALVVRPLRYDRIVPRPLLRGSFHRSGRRTLHG